SPTKWRLNNHLALRLTALRRKITLRIDGRGLIADLEVQLHRIRPGTAHGRNLLPRLHVLTIIDQHRVVMRIRRNVVLTMLNHDLVTVSTKLVTDLDHLPGA